MQDKKQCKSATLNDDDEGSGVKNTSIRRSRGIETLKLKVELIEWNILWYGIGKRWKAALIQQGGTKTNFSAAAARQLTNQDCIWLQVFPCSSIQ